MNLNAGDKTDIKTRLAQYAPIEMTFDDAALNEDQKQVIEKLKQASEYMDKIFWKQSYAGAAEIRDSLENLDDSHNKDLLHYVNINYGPFDRLEHFKPFIGTKQKPLGAGFYPEDLTKEEFEKYIEVHPNEKDQLMSPFTVIKRDGDKLVGVPYHVEYKELLEPASRLLKEASEFTDNPSLKKHLLSRAEAFLTDDYFQSDVDWIDLTDNLIDVTIGPYEVYEDALMGIKTAYEACIMIKDIEESRQLEIYFKHLNDLEKNLPIPDEYKTEKSGLSSPMSVVTDIYRAGDMKAGYQAVAFNLPNDEKVRELKGSKKMMLKNVIAARVNKVIIPISEMLIRPDQSKDVTPDGFFNGVLMHEIAHALGPGFVRQPNGSRLTVNACLKEHYPAIEEAKATAVGFHSLAYFIDKGIIPRVMEKKHYASYLGSIFRTIRFGITEAHGRASMIELNYLMKHGAIGYDDGTDKYFINRDKIRESISKLAHELLMIQATGDYNRAEKLIHDYGNLTKHVENSLARLKNIPVDVELIYK